MSDDKKPADDAAAWKALENFQRHRDVCADSGGFFEGQLDEKLAAASEDREPPSQSAYAGYRMAAEGVTPTGVPMVNTTYRGSQPGAHLDGFPAGFVHGKGVPAPRTGYADDSMRGADPEKRDPLIPQHGDGMGYGAC